MWSIIEVVISQSHVTELKKNKIKKRSVWFFTFAFSKRRLHVAVDIFWKPLFLPEIFCNLGTAMPEKYLCFHLRWYNDKVTLEMHHPCYYFSFLLPESRESKPPQLLADSDLLIEPHHYVAYFSLWPCCKLWKRKKKRTCSKKKKKNFQYFFSIFFLKATHSVTLGPGSACHDSIWWLSLTFPLCGCVRFTHMNIPPSAWHRSHLTFRSPQT